METIQFIIIMILGALLAIWLNRIDDDY